MVEPVAGGAIGNDAGTCAGHDALLIKTVKRKLYHASGLDDLDFITYFETARLDEFHNLILALERIKENRHNRRFGHPILLGTVCTVEDLAQVFAR
jgi:chlorite dismutase